MTIIVDITLTIDDAGFRRLLDVVPARSAQVLSSCLESQPVWLRQQITAVTMDGFTGYVTAVDQMLPKATKVMGPFPHDASDR